VTWASGITPEATYWAWADGGFGRIPVGELCLVAGHGEVGKSIFNTWLIAAITRGELPGHWFGVPRRCLIAASEDDWSKTILPRLMAAEADLELVGQLDIVTKEYPDGSKISLPKDYGELERAITSNSVALTFFDSVVSAIDIMKDTNHGQAVRDILEPLAKIARRTESIISGNLHFNKSSGSDSLARISGSMEFRNVARAVIYLASTDHGTGVISKAKNNLGKAWSSLEYEITEATVAPGITAGRLEMIGPTDLDAAVLIGTPAAAAKKLSPEIQVVADVLADMFRSRDEWDSKDAWQELESAGCSTNPKTVKKAMESAGIRSERVYVEGKKGVGKHVWTNGKLRFESR